MRKKAVNVVAFGNVFQLLRSFWSHWELSKADKLLEEASIGWMLLPMRNVSKNFLKAEVFCYEDAWNTSDFIPAVKKLVGDLKFAIIGSPTTQSGASVLDRVSGMNFDGQGTVVDWLLFGNIKEAFDEYQWIRRTYREAIETVHSLNDGGTVIELHPEFRREICQSFNLSQEEFIDWLISSEFPVCVDTFHTFLRGSRDGNEKDPIVHATQRMDFLQRIHHRIREVHFRLSKAECALILQGKARQLSLYNEMRWMYLICSKAVFVLEIYPDLFATQTATAEKVVKLWNYLEKEFTTS